MLWKLCDEHQNLMILAQVKGFVSFTLDWIRTSPDDDSIEAFDSCKDEQDCMAIVSTGISRVIGF